MWLHIFIYEKMASYLILSIFFSERMNNKRKKTEERKGSQGATTESQETSSSTGKPVLSFGLDFAMWSASRVLRLYWVVLSIMWNESEVNIWPVSV